MSLSELTALITSNDLKDQKDHSGGEKHDA